MINGYFNEIGQLYFTLDLITEDEYLSVDALLDTGFTGLVAINKQDVHELNWSFIREQPMQTAQGLSVFEIYLGTVMMDETLFQIPIHVGENIQEILLGIGWLSHFDLMAQYRQNNLTLTQ
ncbi:MAG: aspartyl protease [Microcystaceae cyanobacterium]